MITTSLNAIGWTAVFVTVSTVAVVSLYLMVLVILSAVAPGAFT